MMMRADPVCPRCGCAVRRQCAYALEGEPSAGASVIQLVASPIELPIKAIFNILDDLRQRRAAQLAWGYREKMICFWHTDTSQPTHAWASSNLLGATILLGLVVIGQRPYPVGSAALATCADKQPWKHVGKPA
jgi:hypothetical protein